MKTVAKVFLILSAVGFGCGALAYLILSFVMLPASLISLVGAIIFCVPVILNILTFKKLDTAKSKKEILGLAIATMLLGGFIGGLLVLCMDESYFGGVNTHSVSEATKGLNTNTLEKDLTKLKELRDNGTLTEEEYAEARKKAIDKSVGGK